MRLACEDSGRGRATLKVTRKAAKRLKLRGRTVAAKRLRCVEGKSVTVRMKPKKSAARRLARSKAKRLRLTVKVRVAGHRALKRRVTIR